MGAKPLEVNIDKLRKGDQEELSRFITALFPRVREMLVRLSPTSDREIVDDVTQDALMKIVERLDRITSLDDPRKLIHYCLAVARNTLFDYYRRSRTPREVAMCLVEEIDLNEIPDLSVLETLHDQELSEILDTALDRLEAKDRELLEAIYLHGETPLGLAKRLPSSPRSPYIQISRARKNLQKHITELLEERRGE